MANKYGLRIPADESDANEQFDRIATCEFCRHWTPELFDVGACGALGGVTHPYEKCECHVPVSKELEYWIHKLIESMLDFDGNNDFMRSEINNPHPTATVIKLYADIPPGTEGTIVRRWRTPDGTGWTKLFFGTNQSGQKLSKSFPDDILNFNEP